MKKLLNFSFGGITAGITTLMVAYLCIYYIAGIETFAQEISQLQQIQTLQYQLIITGISGLLISLSVYNLECIRKAEKQSPFKNVVGIVLLFITVLLTMMLIDTINKNVSDMMLIIEVVLFAIYCLANCVREAWNEFVINKKIKQNNRQHEKGSK